MALGATGSDDGAVRFGFVSELLVFGTPVAEDAAYDDTSGSLARNFTQVSGSLLDPAPAVPGIGPFAGRVLAAEMFGTGVAIVRGQRERRLGSPQALARTRHTR